MIEAGALLGASTVVMAEKAARVISIDRHQGYGPSTLNPFLSNVAGFSNVIPVVADARRIIGSLKGDKYFIDLDGSYETTKAVLEEIPYTLPVAIHDFRRQNCSGVEKAILELDYEVQTVVDTLAVIRRR